MTTYNVILDTLCGNDDFCEHHKSIINMCIVEFIKLSPWKVMHAVIDEKSSHQERDLFSHIVLALQALKITNHYQFATTDDKVRLVLAVLLHDVGKAVQWKGIDTSTGRWHFHGHDTVGACWFWSLVKKNGWDEKFFRPVFLAIWYHMVKSQENVGLLAFLKDHDALHITECLHCADDYGRLEVQDNIPEMLNVRAIPEIASIPNLPIVVYICGKSGTGKTTLARKTMEELSDILTGYVSFDNTILRIIGGINEPWADADPVIRGNKYKTLYNYYQKNAQQREQVREGLSVDFKTSVENNTVTLFTTTTSKPSPHVLPFISQRQLSIVTVPDRQNCTETFFGSLRMSMEASRRGCGWSSKGALIYVPEQELVSCIRHVVKCRTMNLEPPKVTRPSHLVQLFNYWEHVTGSIDGMKYAIESFYDVSVTVFAATHGSYYNFSYRDGASYDDPFYRGSPSPAIFCRGTTFHYHDGNWKLVRLPMNRGREIAFTPIAEAEAEDNTIPTLFYSNLVRDAMTSEHLITAKVDGSLLIVFVDNFGLEQNPKLANTNNIIFGTKGMVVMTDNIVESLCVAVKASGHTIQSFSDICVKYISTHNVYSLSFEMVAQKRDELVVDYPTEQHGLYFLGASRDDIFEPYFNFDSHPVSSPITKSMTIQDASVLPLGPFHDHMEGGVIWVVQDGLYFPLKLKTVMYYLMHKPQNRPGYLDYLIQLIDEYGWYGSNPPTRDNLDEKKLVLSLFALVNLPDATLQVLPTLREARAEYDRLHAITGTSQDLRASLNAKDYQSWRRFNSIYGNSQYTKAYELTPTIVYSP